MMPSRQQPIIVLSQDAKRDQGKQAQLANIQAGKTVADIVRTTMGPQSMLKMLLDPMGGIVMTNDGNAILREVDVAQPAAKTVIELSRAQDEEVGDGTTSVVVLTGELLSLSEVFLTKHVMHPTRIVAGYLKALEDGMSALESISTQIDINNREKLLSVVESCLGTKFSGTWGPRVAAMALEAAQTVTIESPNMPRQIDIKRYVRVEKIPGGNFEDSQVVKGCMINKDVTHAKIMRRYIKNPRVVLLDCPLEYKKGESQTNVEITSEADWEKLLKQEEMEVRKMCASIIDIGCDIVVTEKGVSDLAAHFLCKAGVAAIRRVKKTDNNRLARVTGATIVNRPEELSSRDVGTQCKLFRVEKIGDEYFTYFVECENPRACTVVLRGASKDVLNEIERNFQDAVNVARNILLEGKLVPGGGAAEMAVSARLQAKSKAIEGVLQWPYRVVAASLEIIPRTLAENCGANVVRTITDLRARHSMGDGSKQNEDAAFWGIDGKTGKVTDMRTLGVWDTFAVKQQVLKTAVETAAMILRIDDVLAGCGKKEKQAAQGVPEDPETFGDSRDG